MKIVIDNKEIEVNIIKKRSNKNTYIRVKDDLEVYVTTNYYTKDKVIEKLIQDNFDSIKKMYQRKVKQKEYEEKFYYLGKKYDIVYLNSDNLVLGDDKIFIKRDYNLNKWLLERSQEIFKEELDKMYKIFPIEIPYPSLTIRKMKTRWGVCNVKTKRITLNLELIKKDFKYLDYVIVHELSHLVFPNHQKEFWSLVSQVIPNYKELRKDLREYE